MSGSTHPPRVGSGRSADNHVSTRDARLLVRHYLEWMPFGGAGADDVFVNFGVTLPRYRVLVSAAVDLVGAELSVERRTRIRSSLSSGRRRAA